MQKIANTSGVNLGLIQEGNLGLIRQLKNLTGEKDLNFQHMLHGGLDKR